MGFIPETIIDEIRNRSDIVEVISGYLPLKRAGRNFKAICPFHHERTPSFIVSPDRQIYHCFGCGEGGNVFSFIMKQERCTFYESAGLLAQRANVKIPMPSKEDALKTGLADALRRLNELAANYYSTSLMNKEQGARARLYLAKRDVSDETVRKFRLGYASAEWEDFKSSALSKGVELRLLQDSGLSMFKDRVMFPIFDVRGRVVGFGGRALSDGGDVKYINSPETAAYTKGKNLYGLNLAKNGVMEKDTCIIVEGYFDCISLHQYEFTNAVASLGTALTIDQVRLLKRYARTVVMIYDPDEAGESATMRSIETFLEEDISVRVVSLPQGLDPDACLRKEGRINFEQRLNNSMEFLDFSLRRVLHKYNPDTPDGKVRICSEIFPVVARVKSAILKTEYLKKLAEALKMREDVILSEFKRIIRHTHIDKGVGATLNLKSVTKGSPAERILVGLMLEDTLLTKSVKARMGIEEFRDPDILKIVSALFELSSHGDEISPAKLISHLKQDEQMAKMVSELLPEIDSTKNKDAIVEGCINRIRMDNLNRHRAEIQTRIKSVYQAGDHKETMSLLSKYNELIKTDVESLNTQISTD